MFISRAFQVFLILFLWSTVVFAQTEAEKAEKQLKLEKQAKLKNQLELISSDAANLKVPENKALVYAKLGDIYWKYDESRARQLFQKSIDELIIAQKQAELNRENTYRRNDLLVFGQTRFKILESIIYHDAEFAFKLFLKSRSAVVRDAFAGIYNDVGNYNGMSSDKLIVQQENMMELRLTELVANQNPERAVVIWSGMLRKDVSYNTVELLKKIYQKDKTVADALLAEIIQKILAADFSKSPSEFGAANQLLTAATQGNFTENIIKLDAKTLHNLAEKVAAYLIQEADRNAEFSRSYLVPVLVKILPERAAELQEKTVAPRRSSFMVFPQSKQADDLLQSDAPPEKLLSEADKFPPYYREEIYKKAATKIALAGDIDRAKEILIKNFPVQRRDEMFGSLNWQLAYRAMENGEFDRASEFTDQLPENLRFEVLINLAKSMLKNPKYKQKAASILEKARSSIPAVPSNLNEVNKMGQLAVAYALIEPDTGFELLDRILTKITEVSEANVIVNNFRANTNVNQNEFIISYGFAFSGISELEVPLTELTRIDFEKTFKVINKIRRRDVRTQLQLQVTATAAGNY